MQVAVQASSDAALALIERAMHAVGEIANEYPLIFGTNAPGKLVTAENSKQDVLSTCSILVRELVTPQAFLRAGLVGSVATDPAVRGQGLACKVLARAEEELAAMGCLIALLWADDPTFYEKRGWSMIGSESDWLIPLQLASLLKGAAQVRQAAPSDFPHLHSLYESHRQRVLRTTDESAALYGIAGVELLVAERDGEVTAYAAQGRGRDLQGVIHEWAGEIGDVLTLTAHHAERLNNDVVLLAMSHNPELECILARLGCTRSAGILGMGKVLRLDRIAAWLDRFLGQAGRAKEALGGILLEGPAATIHLRERDVLELLCGLRGERTCAARIEQETGLALPDLPLNVFLWGLDSI